MIIPNVIEQILKLEQEIEARKRIQQQDARIIKRQAKIILQMKELLRDH